MRVLDRPFAREDRFPGWWVVGASFVLLTVSSGVGFYGLAVYLNAFSRELGWTVSSISLATTFFFLVGGLSGLWIAKFIATHDVRIMIIGGALLGTVALASLGFVTQRWQLFVAYALYALGWSAAGLGPVTTVVTRWFHARRASALAVASTGLSMGGIAVTPIVKWLIDDLGIRRGSPWLAAIWLLGVVPITVLFIRPHPHLYGWMPDGERVVGEEPPVISGQDLASAVRSRFFLASSIAFIFAFGAQVGAVQQLVKLLEERSGPRIATFGTIALSATSILGRFAGGRLIPRVPLVRFTIGLVVLQGVSLAALGLVEAAIPMLVIVAVFGSTIGNTLMMQSLLVAERFGVREFPRISARLGLIAYTGTAGGPLLLGVLYDVAGGYRTSYLAAGVCSTIAAAVLLVAATDSEPYRD